jgi:hypothetical protein
MVLEPFRFSLGSRLHGGAGGFMIKGGSYLKRKAEIMPGRREEMPYFLKTGALRSNDLGFRIVLSAIATPHDRNEALGRQWPNVRAEAQNAQKARQSSEAELVLDPHRDPVEEIDRVFTATKDNALKTNLLYLKKVIQEGRAQTGDIEAREMQAGIWKALFAAEAVQTFSVRREAAENELESLEKLKKRFSSEPVPKPLEIDIADARESLQALDAATGYFVRSYIEEVRNSQKYPQSSFEREVRTLSHDLDLKQASAVGMERRLEMFSYHVTKYRSRSEKINSKFILEDIIATTGR